MAETTSVSKLECNFKDEDGKAMSMSFNYAKPTLTDAAAKSLMDGLIENAAAFNNPPAVKVGANLITTTTKPLEVINS